MWAFLVTLAFTLYMTGMIWSMQVFEYPLFALVGRNDFPSYHAAHNRRLPIFVILPSLLALGSAIVLFGYVQQTFLCGRWCWSSRWISLSLFLQWCGRLLYTEGSIAMDSLPMLSGRLCAATGCAPVCGRSMRCCFLV